MGAKESFSALTRLRLAEDLIKRNDIKDSNLILSFSIRKKNFDNIIVYCNFNYKESYTWKLVTKTKNFSTEKEILDLRDRSVDKVSDEELSLYILKYSQLE